ncbi:hypothetical protein GGI12_004153 [Dipsacomyces acuminosporus]|nr:hypothetical protein GGI12_004153 [Dipsacomyces acuminosporus]
MRNQRLDTPEDIAAWIAERKSKYPTDANIRLKSGQQQQQHAAQSEIKRKQHPPKGSDVSKKNRIDPGPSGNPLSMLAGYGSGLSDSDNELSSSSDSSKDSGSESESDSAPEVVSAKHQAPNMPFKPSGIAPGADRRKLRVCKYFAMGKCRKGNACPFAHPESIKERLEQEAAAAAAESKARASSSNLLGMLLAKDIERENYRVLQCIEYICDRGFFNLPVEYSLLFKK